MPAPKPKGDGRRKKATGKKLSRRGQLQSTLAAARARVKRLNRSLNAATDRAVRHQLELKLKKARKHVRTSENALRTYDAKRKKAENAIVGGPVGLRTSGVGIVRPGSAPRAVGDSTSVNRKHSFRQRSSRPS